jgi:hypothetical protein
VLRPLSLVAAGRFFVVAKNESTLPLVQVE